MFPRVGGAILALAAAVLLALATFVPAWWSGHPDVDGHAMRLKSLEIGPLGAQTCNTGGDGKCTNTSLTTAWKTVGRIEAGVDGLVAVLLIALAIATWRRADGRRIVGKAILVATAVAALGGLVLIALGPGIKADGHTLSVPIGFGLVVFWLAIGTSVAAAIVTAREISRFVPRAVRVSPLASPANAMLPAPQPFDVQALLAAPDRHDEPRPAPPAPELPQGAQSPGGALPGFSGPLGSPQHQPLFASARGALDRRPGLPGPARLRPPTFAPPIPRRPVTMPPPPRPATMPPSKPTSVPPRDSFVLLPSPPRAGTDPGDLLETRQHEREEISHTDLAVERGGGDDHTSPSVNLPPTDEATDEVPDETGVNPIVPIHDEADPDTDEPSTVPALPPPPATPEPTDPELTAPQAPHLPMSTASTSLPPPTGAQVQAGGPSPACPQCESPMAWVEEHLRFYCKSCRMYF